MHDAHYLLAELHCIKIMKITCDIEMSIAGGLANFVSDDTLIDTAVCMAHRADDHAVDVTDYSRKQRGNDMKHTGLLVFLCKLVLISQFCQPRLHF